MVNEYTYCPRLAYLEWVQGEWAESADTVEGRHEHRRVDKASGQPPAADVVVEERIHVRSLELSSDTLGIIAKLDLAEFEGRRAVPVDYKRGKRPHVPHGAYEPERVQLCVQALLLEEHCHKAARLAACRALFGLPAPAPAVLESVDAFMARVIAALPPLRRTYAPRSSTGPPP